MTSTCQICKRELGEGDTAWRYQARKVTFGKDGEETHPRLPDTYDCLKCTDSRRKGQLLRITSVDDTAYGVTVRLAQDDGTEVVIDDSIESITWTVSSDTVNTAVVTFNRVELDVFGRIDETEQVTPYEMATPEPSPASRLPVPCPAPSPADQAE